LCLSPLVEVVAAQAVSFDSRRQHRESILHHDRHEANAVLQKSDSTLILNIPTTSGSINSEMQTQRDGPIHQHHDCESDPDEVRAPASQCHAEEGILGAVADPSGRVAGCSGRGAAAPPIYRGTVGGCADEGRNSRIIYLDSIRSLEAYGASAATDAAERAFVEDLLKDARDEDRMFVVACCLPQIASVGSTQCWPLFGLVGFG
jgi:hypothetical protein